MATVWRHTDSGPLHMGELTAEQCAKNPWTNLLYINNFFTGMQLNPNSATYASRHDDGQCLGQTWYLANDMQFFIIAPPITYVIWKWKRIGLAFSGLLLAASLAIPSALTYHYGWGPKGQGTSTKDFMTWFYYKPWTRFSPYMVGILLGYLLHNTKSKPFKMSKVKYSLNEVLANKKKRIL